MTELEKTGTDVLVKEISILEQEINIKILRYEKIRQELIKRYPTLEEQEVYKEKKLIKKED